MSEGMLDGVAVSQSINQSVSQSVSHLVHDDEAGPQGAFATDHLGVRRRGSRGDKKVTEGESVLKKGR